MVLVDYSDSESEPEPASAEKPPTGLHTQVGGAASHPSPLPPLPAAFHDLYASTVRSSTVDDPHLHQGRTRQIPHVAGNWPSHVYVEWLPSPDEHALLAGLVSALQQHEAADSRPLHSFLASDLGAPLPLHISLSRPFALRTDEKDAFLERLTSSIQASSLAPFSVSPYALNFHLSPDSNRAFLVLRVKVAAAGNPELVALLGRCNALLASFGQPALYGTGAQASAFHVSVAWTLASAPEVERLEAAVSEVYARAGFVDAIREVEIPVAAVKVKIGNVVTSVSLDASRRGSAGAALFHA